MKKTKIKVIIDGKEYTQQSLEKIYIDRCYDTLHELKKLGAKLFDMQGKEIAASEIDILSPENVRSILLSNKLRIGKDELNRLYDEQYRQADKMWTEIIAKSDGDYSKKAARAHIIVTGLTFSKYLKIIASAIKVRKFLLAMHPDHIDATMTSVTEIMGMYGKPTQMIGKLKEPAPAPTDKEHNLRLIGASFLTSSPSKKNAVAMHQVKKIKGGIDMLAGAYFPSATPQELVDGHSIHMALEISNVFKNVM